jgi:hypothetical protein
MRGPGRVPLRSEYEVGGSVAGVVLQPHLTSLDVDGVTAGDADHAGDGDEGRDQMLDPALPVGVGRRCGQLDEDGPPSGEDQPHDELDLSRQVVERIGHDDDVTVLRGVLPVRGDVLDRTGRVLLGLHRETVVGLDQRGGIPQRSTAFAGGTLGVTAILLAVAAACPENPDIGAGPQGCDGTCDVECPFDSVPVVGVERPVFLHATSSEVHDRDVEAGRELGVQVGHPALGVAAYLHRYSPHFRRTSRQDRRLGSIIIL